MSVTRTAKIKKATELGRLIYEARTVRKWGLVKTAKFCKVSRRTLIELELGIRTNPTFVTVMKIATTLGIDPVALYCPKIAKEAA